MRSQQLMLKSLPSLVVPVYLISALAILANAPSFGTFSLPHGSQHRPSSPSPTPMVNVMEHCDIFRGEWVPDVAEPPYTNRSCGMIQAHQNCMKHGRPDVGFLRWRWRPAGCELPRFDAAQFLRLVRHRSLAFVGDSIARNHMRSLLCLLSQGGYPKDVSTTKPSDQTRTHHYEAYNFTVAIFWSPFLVRAREPDHDGPAHTGLWRLYTWVSTVAEYDYVVISAANWFSRPSMFYERRRLVGCSFCGREHGVPDLTLRYSQRAAYRTALRAVGAGLNGRRRGQRVIVRTLSPMSHFENGTWDRGGDCRRTRPYGRNETRLGGLDLDFYRAQVEEFTAAAAAAARGSGPHNDCIHWCLPGPIDVWNQMLFQMLLLP